MVQNMSRIIFCTFLLAAGCSEDATTAGTTQVAASSVTASTSGAGGQGGTADVGGAAGNGGAPVLPERLVLSGLASGTVGMETVTCDLEGEFIDLVLDGNDITGFFSGEFLRSVEVGQNAFQFEPLVAGPALIDRLTGSAADLYLVGDQPTDAKPYWLEIEVLHAEEVAPYEFEGGWSCAPLEIDGNPPDFTATVTGTFRLAPP